MNLAEISDYRKDIDGLRAIAVIAVIFFHFGILPNGYLGVDVFFVISGYLITGIIARELIENKFSIFGFYIRRIRRILPLTIFLVSVSLIIGINVMLPDDLENLAQSVVATNFFSNNILQAITTKNYWDIVNEFKPLMHTWSLGIEEQYYIAYPILLVFIGRNHSKYLLSTLILISFISVILFVLPFEKHEKFYYLPFRFFELAFGGIAALHMKNRVIIHNYSSFLIFGLVIILFGNIKFIPDQFLLLIATVLTLGIIVTENNKNSISTFILQNRISVGIGLISFSLYMWHQIILAYVRYFVIQKLELFHLCVIFIIVLLFSTITYYFIEKPFRNSSFIKTFSLLSLLAILFFFTTLFSLYIYSMGGVIKDIPELGITKLNARRNMHANYNSRIRDYDISFANNHNKIKILIIGNSFGRDWANVLLESNFSDIISISYIENPLNHPDTQSRIHNADIIFYSTAGKEDVIKLGINEYKLYVVGTKNFGINSGYFYNYSGDNYFAQRTLMEDGYMEQNIKLKNEWGKKYINIIGKIIDKKNTVPVFTPDKMFISQDCRHFTKAGAKFFASLFENELLYILNPFCKEKNCLRHLKLSVQKNN